MKKIFGKNATQKTPAAKSTKTALKAGEKPVYILCPRCELNYIDKRDKYCDVCKAELGLIDPSILIPDEEEIGIERLCPVCHINPIDEDEDMCIECRKEAEAKEKEAAVEEPESDFVVQEFIDDTPVEDVVEEEELALMGMSIEDEDSIDAEEEEEEVFHNHDDDFEYVMAFEDTDDDLDDDDEEDSLDDDI